MAVAGPQFDAYTVDRDPAPRLMARRLRNLYEATPDDVREAGMNWYGNVHDAVRKATGKGRSVMQGAGVVAAVSPNMDWEKNNIDAFDELSSLSGRQWDAVGRSARSGGRTDEAKDALRGMGIAQAPDQNLLKAKRIWVDGEDPEQVLDRHSGPKTNSFMHNIAAPHEAGPVTVDGRHADILVDSMRPWTWTGRKISTAGNKNGRPTRYERYEDATRSAARSAGVLPHQLQAVTWEFGKHVEKGFNPNRTNGDRRTGQSYQQRVSSFQQGAYRP